MKLYLLFAILIFSTLTYCQKNTEIRVICPKDPIVRNDSIFNKGHKIFGIYQKENGRYGSIIKEITGKDTITNDILLGEISRVVLDTLPPLFIIYGLNLTDNKIFPGLSFNDKMLYPGESITFLIQPPYANEYIIYTLFAIGDIDTTSTISKNPFSSINNYQLKLRTNINGLIKDKLIVKTNILAWPVGGYEGGGFIRWIGEINNDNLLDMLIMEQHIFHTGEVKFFISENGESIAKNVSKYLVSFD